MIWFALLILLALPLGLILSARVIVSIIIPVYFHFYLRKRFYKNGEKVKYVLFTTITLIIFGFICEHYCNIPVLKDPFLPFSNTNVKTAFNFGFSPLIAVIISTYYKNLIDKYNNQVQEMREGKIKAELALLKSQVNPHFFFNILNTLFSMASVKGDEETARGISKFSELMRYMIYDASVDLISLNREIEHINNFIELQKLRFEGNDALDLKLEIIGDSEAKSIPPMLLIPFIENAYKYGYSLKQKSEIRIQFMIEGERAQFIVMNRINTKSREKKEHSGVGIKNVRKRLELLYPNDHELKISYDPNYFTVSLNIPL